MTVLDILLAKANSAADQSHFKKRSHRDDGADVVDVAASPSLNVTLLTPLPKARAADNILNELRNVHLNSDEDFTNLFREQLFAPVVMLPLAGDYYVGFGGPRPAREPMDFGTGKKIRLTVVIFIRLCQELRSQAGFLRGLVSDVPKVVFDIGGLFIKSDATTPGRRRISANLL